MLHRDVQGPVTVSVSIGSVTSGETAAATAETLLREADRAMYELKRRRASRPLGLVGEGLG